MSFEHLPEKARNSALVQTLDIKLQQPPQTEFDYRAELVRLAKQVTADVAHINELFPEYTPHDALYHLNRLFHVADLVVEKNRFEALNAAELFILAASLYAHDWGMAVSKTERDVILGVAKGETTATELAILPDERDRLWKFATSCGCTPQAVVETLKHWRDYVRETHPERSALRSRMFFNQAGGGMGDGVARVSRGHGIDISELEKANEFPTDFSVHGLNVNLRGLAVYVRLIDLLDIADDRTPYAVWKFVSPCDPKSAEEWSKHRALNPVTCPPYQNGRMVLVDGSTSDPDVWAALRDLERYVKTQVRECNDLLARMSDTRFHLDLPIVEWRTATPGFTPIDLRFEFQRESMFRILSDEIYEGDVYVFLRELLQNSIDAIRLRSGMLTRQGLTMAGIVCFEVLHRDDGFATIRCRDNGVGMDAHIIRNYLALAGRSYYSSDEFKHLGLDIDAIARFGIGILSCFMAGESIEIETRRDPNLFSNNDSLRVVVPSVERQFRVYPGGNQQKIGTTITVHVCGKRIKTAPEGWNTKMRVADYVAEVGGFCEFPILVTEDGVNSLIVHPSFDENAAISIAAATLGVDKNPSHFQIRKVAQDYPWSEVFVAQDEAKAKSAFSIVWYDLKNDLNLSDSEGKAGILVPCNQEICALAGHNEDITRETVFYEQKDSKLVSARWYQTSYYRTKFQAKISRPRSIDARPTTHTSCNGILVAGNNELEFFRGRLLPEPAIWINFARTSAIQLNVARQDSKQELPPWRKNFTEALHRRIIGDQLEKLKSASPSDRLHWIGKLMCWYNIESAVIGANLPQDKWPIARLDQHGGIEIIDHVDWESDSWPVLPQKLVTEFLELFRSEFYNWTPSEKRQIKLWRGELALIGRSGPYYDSNYEEAAANFVGWVAEQTHPIIRMRFIRGPRTPSDLIPQVVRVRGEAVTDENLNLLLERAISQPASVQSEHWGLLSQFINVNMSYRIDMECEWFLPPHDSLFACGCAAWNTQHPLVRELLRCSIALHFAGEKKLLPPAQLGVLNDHLTKLTTQFRNTFFCQAELQDSIATCMNAFSTSGLLPVNQDLKAPREDEFVPRTIIKYENQIRLLTAFIGHRFEMFEHTYGEMLS